VRRGGGGSGGLAVAALRAEQGYVQGMSFLAACLLEFMSVEESFVCLVLCYLALLVQKYKY
jgi:hypothetical protein